MVTLAPDPGLPKHPRLADDKIPKRFHILEVFPTLPNGKIDKRAWAPGRRRVSVVAKSVARRRATMASVEFAISADRIARLVRYYVRIAASHDSKRGVLHT